VLQPEDFVFGLMHALARSLSFVVVAAQLESCLVERCPRLPVVDVPEANRTVFVFSKGLDLPEQEVGVRRRPQTIVEALPIVLAVGVRAGEKVVDQRQRSPLGQSLFHRTVEATVLLREGSVALPAVGHLLRLLLVVLGNVPLFLEQR